MKTLSKLAVASLFGLLVLSFALSPLAAFAAGSGTKLTPVTQPQNNLFAQSTAIYGNYAIVGMPEHDALAQDAGTVHIYQLINNVWTPEAIVLPELQAGDLFGQSVAITIREGIPYAIVGAPMDDQLALNAGAAYIFQRDITGQWLQIAKVTPSNSMPANAQFGTTVAMFEDYALVGAPQEVTGEAYLIHDLSVTKDWSNLNKTKLSAVLAQNSITLQTGDLFGQSLAISGKYLVVGAPEHAARMGAAYTFKMDGTNLIVKDITPVSLQPEARFGYAVAITTQGKALVGAPMDSQKALHAGAAYLFELDGMIYKQPTKLMAVDQTEAQFGYSVALFNDIAVVGAPYRDLNSKVDVGTTYIFRKEANTWMQREIKPEMIVENSLFGLSVAIFQDLAIVGAPQTPESLNLGTATIFKRDGFNTWIKQAQLTPESMDLFGQALALSGDIAVVGAPHDNGRALNTGAVHIYERINNQWVPTVKLMPQTLQSGDQFGYSVALLQTATNEHYLVVGAPYRDVSTLVDAGAVYIFKRVDQLTWQPEGMALVGQKAQALFGFSVAMSEMTNTQLTLVGAPGDMGGTAYLFERTIDPALQVAWQMEEMLRPAMSNTQFGYSVALQNDHLVVGAPHDVSSLAVADTGAAYVFELTMAAQDIIATQESKLAPQTLQTGDLFGQSVAIDLNVASDLRVLVGAPQDDTRALDAGAAYLFQRDQIAQTWMQETKLMPEMGQLSAQFGYAVALSNQNILIGAYGENLTAGAAYAYKLDGLTWKPSTKLMPDLLKGDQFGKALVISGSDLMIGAPMADLQGFDTGFVFANILGQ